VKYFAAAILVALLLAVACKTNPPDVPADPSFAGDIQTIFNSHCISCHGNSSPPAGYSLTSHAGALSNGSDTIPNVIAGSADSSKLYRKVKGIETPQMPYGQPPLDSVNLEVIQNWINKGAKNN
jgi:mono/diheme cytochrome c family protein